MLRHVDKKFEKNFIYMRTILNSHLTFFLETFINRSSIEFVLFVFFMRLERAMSMSQSLLEMAKDLVMTMIQAGALAPEDMQQQLQKTHRSLLELKSLEEVSEGDGTASEQGAMTRVMSGELADWRKSIKKYTIECLVCGASFKQLSVRHLRTHELDPRSYRQRFGIPRTQPLSAKATTAVRKQIVQKSRPWEKAPTYAKAQQEKVSQSAPAKTSRAKKASAATDA